MSRLSDLEIGKPMDENEERLQSLAENKAEKQDKLNRIINDPNFDIRDRTIRDLRAENKRLVGELKQVKSTNTNLNNLLSDKKVFRNYTGEIKCQ
ncbi:MAG: hypothetical protein GOVbin707_48 [Prokaryotic dsDNA virus sp.]|nr:MAG: hypothetical protein GOVbin707_48 [Prokaryotic dsDNA virus sp.]|tara:strand:- start:5472 stop:5756 length:285 start_codon:yes stop_codon:yes gene_type:complete